MDFSSNKCHEALTEIALNLRTHSCIVYIPDLKVGFEIFYISKRKKA